MLVFQNFFDTKAFRSMNIRSTNYHQLRQFARPELSEKANTLAFSKVKYRQYKNFFPQ